MGIMFSTGLGECQGLSSCCTPAVQITSSTCTWKSTATSGPSRIGSTTPVQLLRFAVGQSLSPELSPGHLQMHHSLLLLGQALWSAAQVPWVTGLPGYRGGPRASLLPIHGHLQPQGLPGAGSSWLTIRLHHPPCAHVCVAGEHPCHEGLYNFVSEDDLPGTGQGHDGMHVGHVWRSLPFAEPCHGPLPGPARQPGLSSCQGDWACVGQQQRLRGHRGCGCPHAVCG